MIEPTGEADYESMKTYALFGLAIFQSSCIETALHTLLATAERPRQSSFTQLDYDKLMMQLERMPFSRLVDRARRSGLADPAILSELESAVESRNWLAHRYFRQRAVDFTMPDGIPHMQAELESLANSFRALQLKLFEPTRLWAKARGLSEDVFEQEEERMRQEWLDLH